MSSYKPNIAAASMRRNPSEDNNDNPCPQQVKTHPAPLERDIPLPEFYPTERTSTASFKAPMTAQALAAKKKLEEVPPPPPPGTLSTAMSYITTTTPVKYISSIFTKPPPPEPPQIKERVFKFDLEKKDKEKQSSPRASFSLKRVQQMKVEEVHQQPTKASSSAVNTDKKESAWRRKNMIDNAVPPLSPVPSKFRSQSPVSNLRRSSTASIAALVSADTSPTNLNQLKIASSSAQNAFKVMSKVHMTKEEPDKKKKKDPRNTRNNTRFAKDVKDNIPQLTNNSKSIPKYNPPPSTKKYSSNTKVSNTKVSNTKEDTSPTPTKLKPTLLTPRVPPATYTIRSSNTEDDGVKDQQDMMADLIETERMDNTSAVVESATNNKAPNLVAHKEPVVGLLNRTSIPPTILDMDDEELKLEETLGLVDNIQAKVTRLDQLPLGSANNADGESTLKGLFRDAKLMNNDLQLRDGQMVFHPARERSFNVQLCSAAVRYPSADSMPYKSHEMKKSIGRSNFRQQGVLPRDMSPSPPRKAPSPIFIRSDSRAKPAFRSESPTKAEIKDTPASDFNSSITPQLTHGLNNSKIPMETSNTIKKNANQKKEKESPEKIPSVSPLKVDKKYKALIDEQRNQWKRSKPEASGMKSPLTKDASLTKDRAKATKPVEVKPNIVSRPISKPKDKSPGFKSNPDFSKSPEVSKKSSTTASEAQKALVAVAAAATAAAVATATAIKERAASPPKSAFPPASAPAPAPAPVSDIDNVVKEDKHARHRSLTPPWKKEKETMFRTGSPKKVSPTPKAKEELSELPTNPVTQVTPQANKPSLTDLLKQKILPHMDIGKDSKIETTGHEKTNRDADETDEFNLLDNYCGDPAKYARAATMMGELP